MAITEARKRANKKWDEAHPMDRIQLVIREGGKDLIKAAADTAGESINHYILQATVNRMVSEGMPVPMLNKENQ